MILGHFRLNPIEVNAFIFGCPETKEAVLVDVGEWDPRLPQFVEDMGLALTTIFITHDHYDHVAGLPEAAEHFDVAPTDLRTAFGRAAGMAIPLRRHKEEGVAWKRPNKKGILWTRRR